MSFQPPDLQIAGAAGTTGAANIAGAAVTIHAAPGVGFRWRVWQVVGVVNTTFAAPGRVLYTFFTVGMTIAQIGAAGHGSGRVPIPGGLALPVNTPVQMVAMADIGGVPVSGWAYVTRERAS